MKDFDENYESVLSSSFIQLSICCRYSLEMTNWLQRQGVLELAGPWFN